jgi:hypothetical protein
MIAQINTSRKHKRKSPKAATIFLGGRMQTIHKTQRLSCLVRAISLCMQDRKCGMIGQEAVVEKRP